MSFSLTAALTITYGPVPHQVAAEKAKQVRLASHHKSQLHLVDHMEKSLSREILAMQRSVRAKKRQEHDAKPTCSATVEQAEAKTAESDRFVIKDHSWEHLSLADLQSVDLQAMNLTDLPAALLEHPKGKDVEYTELDKKDLRALFERKVSRRQHTT